MCLIVDANVAGHFANSDDHPYLLPVIEWIRKSGKIALGGKLTQELLKAGMRAKLLAWDRAGRTMRYSEGAIASEEAKLKKLKVHKSNDVHIIALARVSCARILVSKDQKLMDDFRHPQLLNKPRGKIYTSSRNENLLAKCPKCKPTS